MRKSKGSVVKLEIIDFSGKQNTKFKIKVLAAIIKDILEKFQY